MRKKITVSTTITLVILAVALTISITMLLAMRYFNRQIGSVQQRQSMYTHINDVDKKVREYYPDLDEELLRQNITEGYVNGINDSYAAYFTAAEYAAEQRLLAGGANDLGIGLCVDSQGRMAISSVNADSPAAKSGVQAGDILTAIGLETVGCRDDIMLYLISVGIEPSLAFKTMEAVRAALGGEKVLISVLRGTETLAFEMTPFTYTLRSVQQSMSDGVGYIKITGFYDNTPEQFRSTVSALKEQGVIALVFDLRGNVGGSPAAVKEMLSYVMPLGQYGFEIDKDGVSHKLSSDVNNQLGVPTATLVDATTAGEAEFFAGVLQDASLTTVVGETTAGEAKYQAYFPLESDGSVIKLTVGEYGRLKSGSWQGVGIRPEIRHCCNSGATILYPEFALDMVRPGIITYGNAPSDELEGALSLRPMMSLHSMIAQVRTVPAGTDISYGRLYRTKEETRVAVLPIGYADGLSRLLTGKASFYLQGHQVPVIGRICMDMCMIDVSGVPEAKPGDVVTIFGYDDDGTLLPCERLARAQGTINYELLCQISKRIPRICHRGAETSQILQYIV